MYVIFEKNSDKKIPINSWLGIAFLIIMGTVLWHMYTDEFANEAKIYINNNKEIINKYGAEPILLLSESRHISDSIDYEGKSHEGYKRYIFSIAGKGNYSTVSVYVYGKSNDPKKVEYSLVPKH